MDESSRRESARRIQRRIAKILLEDWDPIGVRDIPEAQDEYDSYVGGIYRLLVSGATPETLAKHLVAIETEKMGLTPTEPPNRLAVAARLSGVNVKLDRE